jgi:hypothetical protein
MVVIHALCVFVAIMKCCVWFVQVWSLCVLFVYIASILVLLCVVMYKYGYYMCSIYVQCICSYYDMLCVVRYKYGYCVCSYVHIATRMCCVWYGQVWLLCVFFVRM